MSAEPLVARPEGYRDDFAMSDERAFIDYYQTLRVSPDCSGKTLHQAYRYLAKLYHPDHPETADVTKFNEVIEAYKALRNPDERARYDDLHFASTVQEAVEFPLDGEGDDDNDNDALDDAQAHARILLLLYKQRRQTAQEPGVPQFSIRETVRCSEEHLEFHLWYLKAKGFIERTEQGMYAITIEGVDHVIASSQATMKERLLIGQSSHHPDPVQPQPD